MSLLGNAAMVFWHDIATDDDDYKDWHSNEHLTERVEIAGFLRGRRARALTGEPAYFILYEVASVNVLTSKAYLDRLNAPGPWTQRVLAQYRNSNRTLARTEHSLGLGVGGYLLTLRIAPENAKEDALRAQLVSLLQQTLNDHGAITGAHLLMADQTASRTETEEKKLRDAADEVADWIVILEGYEHTVLQSLADRALGPGELQRLGATADSRTTLYQLEHTVSEQDVECARYGNE